MPEFGALHLAMRARLLDGPLATHVPAHFGRVTDSRFASPSNPNSARPELRWRALVVAVFLERPDIVRTHVGCDPHTLRWGWTRGAGQGFAA